MPQDLMTSDAPTVRILVVTDQAHPGPGLKDAICSRAAAGDARFRLVVLNPARAEVHLLHPERHDKAVEAELILMRALPEIESWAGHPVIGSVSVRHDPMDAIEETLYNEPVHEIMLAIPSQERGSWLHHDLQHRLKHFNLPVTAVPYDGADPAG